MHAVLTWLAPIAFAAALFDMHRDLIVEFWRNRDRDHGDDD